MNSILDTIKKMLGIDPSDTSFDVDLIVNINTTLMILRQLGIGSKEGFSITGKKETWDSLIDDMSLFESIKTYIFLRTKSVFDPTSSSVVNESYKQMISELEWRLSSEIDYGGNLEHD